MSAEREDALRRAFAAVLRPIVETPQFQARLAAAIAAEVAGGQVLAADAAARPAPAVTRAMLRDAATLDARKAAANLKRSETQKRNAAARRAAGEAAAPPPDAAGDFQPLSEDVAEARQHIAGGKRAKWLAEEYGWPLPYAQWLCANVDAETARQKAPGA